MKKIFLFILPCIATVVAAQNPAPAGPQKGPVLILHGNIHTGRGNVISDGAIAFDNGKITLVTTASADFDTSKYTVIHAEGKEIYPGFIDCNSVLGLTEIDLVRSTRDNAEVGDMNANVRSAISYNTDSKIIPTLRSNGILLSQVVPQGGTISGQSSVMQLDAWNWEDAIYKADDGIHLNWPGMYIWRNNENDPEDKQRERIAASLSRIESYFRDAKAYAQDAAPSQDRNLRFEAMRGLFDGSKKLYVHAWYVKSIESAVAFCRRMGMQMVLVGGSDAWMVTDLLRKNKVPVIVIKTHNLPPREDSDVDQAYKLPYLLHRDSVQVAISFDGSWNARNLPFDAGTSVAYGLTKEEALQCITSVPAEIIGIADRTGTLEKGKDANIIISTGDALDMRTNNIEYAFIQGRSVVLDDVQKQLYRKYKTKYGF